MKIKNVNVDVYSWKVDIIEMSNQDTFEDAEKALKKYKLGNEIISTIKKEMNDKCKDGGYTFTQFGKWRSVIFLYRMSSQKRRRNVLNHEKRHVEDDILQHLGINDKEAAAYLAGYLSSYIY